MAEESTKSRRSENGSWVARDFVQSPARRRSLSGALEHARFLVAIIVCGHPEEDAVIYVVWWATSLRIRAVHPSHWRKGKTLNLGRAS
jgi:hypothetical protein